MEFRTQVTIEKPPFLIEPCEDILFVGSCFADAIGQRFRDEAFPVTVNPFGVMYNPASILHTLQRLSATVPAVSPAVPVVAGGFAAVPAASAAVPSPAVSGFPADTPVGSPATVPAALAAGPRVAFLTLGTNHVYRLKATGEIVDNCEKRPAALFEEEELSVEQCADYLRQCITLLRKMNPAVHVVFTVSPIRYRKYGYHASQLSKATLLLACSRCCSQCCNTVAATVPAVSPAVSGFPADTPAGSPATVPAASAAGSVSYFPAYELLLDELRDYRFYASDMLHPSAQAVEYIWERLVDSYFSPAAKDFLSEWRPLKQALAHKPFNPDSPDYRTFREQTLAKVAELQKKYPHLAL